MPLPQGFRELSLRHKLLAMVLLPLAGILPLLAAALLWWGDAAFDRLLITKVRADLGVADGYFERVLAEVAAGATALAESHALRLAMASDDDALVRLLQQTRSRLSLDYINLRAPDGTVLLTDSGIVSPATTPAPPGPAPANGIAVLSGAELAVLGPALRGRIDVPLLPTRNAAPATGDVERRAMVLQANEAVRAPDGRVLARIQTGVLLNRNLPFIDHINQIVYPPGSLPFGSVGTATLFLDDVRISTNVRLFGDASHADAPDGSGRAIGTRVSHVVRDAVLGRGHTWLDRAFVVNDWYVSAYQPLRDGAGQRVGMLYVGFLEQPFRWLKYGALAAIGALFVAAMLAAAFVSLRWARRIVQPVQQMEATMRRVEGGDRTARVGAVGSTDELGQLARHFDRLLDTIDGHTRALQQWNAELDAKVAQRTQALETRTRELADTQAHLLRNEKMAAMGQLTASIAHEVNNPIAVLQGNLDLMRELLPPEAAAQVHSELRVADEQIDRMRLIVTQLLQFARPGEYVSYVATVDTRRQIEDALVLVGPVLARAGVTIRTDFAATVQPAIHPHELQQVLVNLLMNAAEATPDGGELDIRSRDTDDGVEITLTDSGGGLAAELMDQLFKPFVTRKKDGTGLGLWISRTIIERYGGELRAANRDDGRAGAVFTVRLPRAGEDANA